MDSAQQAIDAARSGDHFTLLVILAGGAIAVLLGVVWRLYLDREKDRAQIINMLLEDIKSRNRLTDSIRRVIGRKHEIGNDADG